MANKSQESVFQNDIINRMVANGWQLGSPAGYNRELALYEEDVLGFVKETQDEQWQKHCKLYPQSPEKHFLERVATQLNKVDPNATNHELRDRGTRFKLCQFKPDHDLNPDTLARYARNRLRTVPELVYSPFATDEHLAGTGSKAKAWRIDLVLFVNGLPVATMELKSEFKQAVENAIKQYKRTRLPKDPVSPKPEPLLTFKRGALVHFAVSQYEVYMTTRLAGDDTFFLPFNKGTKEGGAGNGTPENKEDVEDWQGKKSKKEALIFPRYHQWDVVSRLLNAARSEGPGHKYLIQHSAGSGKSNSIAWAAHQLSSLYDAQGIKQFHSVIVVTDRTVLDDQLQDTIHQFEHVDGVVGRINRDIGEGSKSEKLAHALEHSQPIIIVTIQTFPFVLQAIENSVSLKERRYAIIADEAHLSQSGSTARQLKEVLVSENTDDDVELTSEDILDATIAARRDSGNLSYFAFTATPKPKILELFGRLPDPELPPSRQNKPEAFHVYSMHQAIEEGFILDVLKNYTNYKVAYQLAQRIKAKDEEVDSKKAQVKLNQWVRLHDYNIAQKVQVIVEHFKDNVMGLLGGQAKAMVVTSSRKEVVRYKKELDKYVARKGYSSIQAMVAFSGVLREKLDEEDDIDLSNVALTHYRLSILRQQNLVMEPGADYKLQPGNDLGSAKAKDKKEEFLSQILTRLNELFITDGLTDKDLINYAHTIRDKVSENRIVMDQIQNNSPEQAMLVDFPKALDDAVMDSSEAHQKQMMQILSNPEVARGFARVVFDLIRQAV